MRHTLDSLLPTRARSAHSTNRTGFRPEVELLEARTVPASLLAAPLITEATPAVGNNINLTWTNIANEAGYLIEHSLDNVHFLPISQTAADVTSLNLTIPIGQDNFFRVRGFNLAQNTTTLGTVLNVGPASQVASLAAQDAAGSFRGGKVFLDINSNRIAEEAFFKYGKAGQLPVAGDWDGDKKDTVGVFHKGAWYQDSGNHVFTLTANFGLKGDKPVVGDWNGDGKGDLGVFRKGTFILDVNGNRIIDAPDVSFAFGNPKGVPVAGDWNGDGKDEVGVFFKGQWQLDLNGNRAVDDVVFTYGKAGDKPIVGNWNGDRRTEIGFVRGNKWFLDANANRILDEGYFVFEKGGQLPLAGVWAAPVAPPQLSSLTIVNMGEPGTPPPPPIVITIPPLATPISDVTNLIHVVLTDAGELVLDLSSLLNVLLPGSDGLGLLEIVTSILGTATGGAGSPLPDLGGLLPDLLGSFPILIDPVTGLTTILSDVTGGGAGGPLPDIGELLSGLLGDLSLPPGTGGGAGGLTSIITSILGGGSGGGGGGGEGDSLLNLGDLISDVIDGVPLPLLDPTSPLGTLLDGLTDDEGNDLLGLLDLLSSNPLQCLNLVIHL